MPTPATLASNLRRRSIPGLDGIRAVSVLAVVAFHGLSPKVPGNFGVQMFFLLSGLLITWLLLREESLTGSVSLRAFYARRAVRLLPALLPLLAWVLLVGRPRASLPAASSAAFYYANYFMATGGDLTGLTQCWSLSVEEHFYLIWPAVFLAIRSRRALMWLCFAAVAVETLYRIQVAYSGRLLYAMFATETGSIGILLGCGLALLLWECPELLPTALLQPWLAVVSLGAIIALAQLPALPQASWGIPVGALFGAVILLQAVAGEWWFLDNPAMRFLGRVSYGIYLWHLVAVDLVKDVVSVPLRVSALFGLAIGFGALSYFLLERPVQSFVRARFSISRPHKSQA